MRSSLLLVILVCSCATTPAPTTRAATGGDDVCRETLERYTTGFLARNPVTATYLGAAGLDPSLADVDARLRDHSSAALEEEDKWLATTARSLTRIRPHTLSPARAIDRQVALAQIRFQLRLHARRHHERALDTYTEEPTRGIDWQLQGMSSVGRATYGSRAEWSRLVARVRAIPPYLATARDQLAAGARSGNFPDQRMLRRNGLEVTAAAAQYFEEALPAIAKERVPLADRAAVVSELEAACREAAVAYRELRRFVERTFFDDPARAGSLGLKPAFRHDHFAIGEAEYAWALRNNLRIETSPTQLYQEAAPAIQTTRATIVALAREIGRARGWALPADESEAVREVRERVREADARPRSDAEMVRWYQESVGRLVAYGRATGLFDVPADYQIAVEVTPLPLRSAISGAAYYPAPPFKRAGVGHFYVTPTGDDPAKLREHNRSSLAGLAAHEGFPGHDWDYKVTASTTGNISPVRWLTPGSVEDSSSMWQDSMRTEGWGLYAEALVSEARPKAPGGFYTPEERLFMLLGRLLRDVRVRVDVGIHTGRLSYDEAVDIVSQEFGFEPGSCRDVAALARPEKKRSCESADRSLYRYSKWPTQAITYRMGHDEIWALRREAERRLGARFSLRSFHMHFLRQGTIPPGYFREELLRELTAEAAMPGKGRAR